jgi:hypothetical protein
MIWTHPHSHIQGMHNLHQASTSATMLSAYPHVHIHGGSAGGGNLRMAQRMHPGRTYLCAVDFHADVEICTYYSHVFTATAG